MKLRCPSCNCESIVIDRVDVDLLSRLYWKKYNVDVVPVFEGIKFLNYLQCEKCGLKYFAPIVTGDDPFYGALEKEDWYYLHDDKFEYTYAKQFINENDKVLDVGSGRGVFSKYIKCGFYQGLDFSSKAIELAKQDGVNVLPTPIQEHCLEKTGFYDVVVLFQVIEHISDVNTFVGSAIKCLRPGGHLIIATPNNDGFVKDAVNCCLNLPPHHVLHWNEKSLVALADNYALEVIDICKEPVAQIHKSWWYTTVVNAYIHKILHRKIHLVDLRFTSWFLHGLSHVIGKLCQLFNWHKSGDGQSIIVVYKKH